MRSLQPSVLDLLLDKLTPEALKRIYPRRLRLALLLFFTLLLRPLFLLLALFLLFLCLFFLRLLVLLAQALLVT